MTKRGNNSLKQQARELARLDGIPYSAALARLNAAADCAPNQAACGSTLPDETWTSLQQRLAGFDRPKADLVPPTKLSAGVGATGSLKADLAELGRIKMDLAPLTKVKMDLSPLVRFKTDLVPPTKLSAGVGAIGSLKADLAELGRINAEAVKPAPEADTNSSGQGRVQTDLCD